MPVPSKCIENETHRIEKFRIDALVDDLVTE